MILVLDNRDSFVYNLARYVRELGGEVVIRRSDEMTLSEVEGLAPSHIVISPGPCTPSEAGISTDVVRRFGRTRNGICYAHAAATAAGQATSAGSTATRPDNQPAQATQPAIARATTTRASSDDVPAHVAVSVGNLVGVAIRLGHREVDRPDCKPDKKIATPVRGIHAENRPVPETHGRIQRRPILGGLICECRCGAPGWRTTRLGAGDRGVTRALSGRFGVPCG